MEITNLDIVRCRKGIKFTLKIAPELEVFFKDWSFGNTQHIRDYGRKWHGCSAMDKLTAWSYDAPDDTETDGYSFAGVGMELFNTSTVNLSMLRLVGASEESGVTFIYDGVASKEGIEKWAQAFNKATKRFYVDYVGPAHVRATVSVLK